MADWVPTSIAARKPFSRDGGTLWTRDIICIHTMVGSLGGSWSWASSKGTVWHFGTSGTGECWQCLPLDRRSGANLHGNHRVVAIENADMGPGFGSWNGQCGHVPPFTAAQVDKLVQLIAWLCVSLNIPADLIPDTRPGRRGIAYHRQGIDPYRCGSCEMWSRATGKCCPDNARIHQLVNVIIPRVRAVIAGAPIKPKEWDEMATEAEIAAVVRAEVGRAMQKLMANRNNTAYNPNNPDHAWLAEAVTLPEFKAEVLKHAETTALRAVQATLGRNNALFDPSKQAWLEESARLNDLEAKLDAILTKLET